MTAYFIIFDPIPFNDDSSRECMKFMLLTSLLQHVIMTCLLPGFVAPIKILKTSKKLEGYEMRVLGWGPDNSKSLSNKMERIENYHLRKIVVASKMTVCICSFRHANNDVRRQ